MSNTTAGLPNNGNTQYYKVQYDKSLGGPGGIEPARSTGLVNNCDADYRIMQDWFSNTSIQTPIVLTVTPKDGGADWTGVFDPTSVELKPGNGDAGLLRYLVVMEVVELFAKENFSDWSGGWLKGDEGSKGEGLSRFLSALFAIKIGIWPGAIPPFNVSIFWLNSPRNDYVNHAPDDNQPDAITGCSTLFLYYLHVQLGFSVQTIIQSGASNLADVYELLTRDSADPFPVFKGLLDAAFPATTNSTNDNPFPLPTTRKLSTRKFIAALGAAPALDSLRLLMTLTNRHSLRPALNSNRPVSLV